MKCWICNAAGNTGEHLIKASDIKSVFGEVNSSKPLYFHTNLKKNQKIQGIKSSILKSNALICAKCNNQITQPHDRAWEKLSNYIKDRFPKIKPSDRVQLHKVFPGAVKKSMLGVHLFFLKVFGCQIAEYKVPINLQLFSDAILNNKPHPNVYIAITPPLSASRSVGGSDITAAKLNGHVVYAVWYYFLDCLTIRVVYAEPGEHRQGLIGTWHPSRISKCIRITFV